MTDAEKIAHFSELEGHVQEEEREVNRIAELHKTAKKRFDKLDFEVVDDSNDEHPGENILDGTVKDLKEATKDLAARHYAFNTSGESNAG